MPLYSYRCPDCPDFEVQRSMGQAPDSLPCPGCGAVAARRFTAPHLSHASSSAYRLIESTQRTAAEPVVTRSPGGGPATGKRPAGAAAVTTNPLHRKLPRPD